MDIAKNDRFKRWNRFLILCVLICGLCTEPQFVSAGEAGVYIKPDVYYTLEEAVLSPGTESQTLSFRLQLTNGGSSAVDLNGFGVMVKDADGQNYSAGLTEKKNARLYPGKVESYAYLAELPVWLKASQLSIMVFAWDYTQPTFMREIGALPLAVKESAGSTNRQKVYIELDELDGTLPDDAMAAFELVRSMRIAKDGGWMLYIDLLVENLGSSSYKLPASLQYILKDSKRLIYLASSVSGGDSVLLPRDRTVVTLSATIPGDKSANDLELHFSKKNAADTIDYGSVELRNSAVLQTPETSLPLEASGRQGLKMRILAASTSKTPEGVKLTAQTELYNAGTVLEAVPGLTSQYQFGGSGISAAAVDNGVHPAFLAPGETTEYRFAATLPEKWGEYSIQMAVLNKKPSGSGTVSIPVALFEMKPEHIVAGNLLPTGIDYSLGEPVKLKPNKLLDERIELSLQSLSMHTNEELGYRTAIAKWKVTNQADTMLTLPVFQTELIGKTSKIYAGTRQNGAPTSLLSNTSYVVSYSYLIPLSETGDSFILHAVDDKTSPSNRLTLAAIQVQPQIEQDTDIVSFYPFQVEFKEHNYAWTYDKADNVYTFKMKLSLNVSKQDQVVVDAGFSKMQFELTDGMNRVIGSQTVSFVGANKLISGKQTINFSNLRTDQIDSNLTIKVYEVIDTPNGQAKRFVKELK